MSDRWDITIKKGATFHRELTWGTVDPEDPTPASPSLPLIPFDLSGYTARWQGRPSPDSDTVLWSCTSDPAGGITLAATAPNIVLDLTDEATSALLGRSGVHGIELEIGGDVRREAEGCVTMLAEIVRDEGTS